MSTTPTERAVSDARRDYESWNGVVPADKARRNARLLTEQAEYWTAYANEVDDLRGPAA